VRGNELAFANTHVSPDAQEREQQVAELVEVLADLGPAAIAGDFNEEGGSVRFDPIVDLGYVDAHEAAGDGYGHTFPAERPVRRIDHIYIGPGLEVLDSWVVESQASDHRPLVADIGLDDGTDREQPAPPAP
jgi:endonuclease/exonuclease/phosphatase family metal-dependent hydrolase